MRHCLNEGREEDPEGDPEGYLLIPARVAVAVREEHGSDALARFHAELWNQEVASGDWVAELVGALQRAGLPQVLADAGQSSAYDAALRGSHDAAVAELGPHVGTPVTAVTTAAGARVAFFGPVLSQVPTGERAGALWDATLLLAATPGFHELKGRAPAAPRL